MLKGLVLCFAVLFAQLAVLNVIDARLYNGQDARQAVSTAAIPHKKDEGEEEEVKQS